MAESRPHIAILGAGPTGLEAALACVDAGYPFTLYEAADGVAGDVRRWGHVRVFTPWSLNVSPRMRRHLFGAGVSVPDNDECPTGEELVLGLFGPIAELATVAPNLRTGTRVLEVGREGLVKSDEIGTGRRAEHRFRLLVEGPDGERSDTADVVLDCTGTYSNPNATGNGGIAAPGEGQLEEVIRRHIPDFAAEADAWAGKTTLVVGAGHSAQTAVANLAALAEEHPGTRILWALRSDEPSFAPDAKDPLPERAALLARAAELAGGASLAVEVLPGVVVDSLARRGGKTRVTLRRSDGAEQKTVDVDWVLSLTGYVGDHAIYRQLQVHECYATSGPMKLAAALLGAGSDDCLDQDGHGADTLVNPEPGFFLLGSKSYGRNNTFLMRVGWQQVEEIFALLGNP